MDEMKLDDELRRALNVDPSPEFLARVRTRIANEPEPSRWRLAWVMAPVAAVSVAVVVGLVTWPQPQPAPPTQVAAPPSVSPAPAPIVEPSLAAPVIARRETGRAERVTQARPFPEVLISESERRAFNSLLAAIEKDTLPARVRAAGEVDESLAPPPVEIDQLTIAPLQLARLE